ncbi:MAG: hypothetical protein Q9160_000467 [Pyrenula sp. 1 TL-2023]
MDTISPCHGDVNEVEDIWAHSEKKITIAVCREEGAADEADRRKPIDSSKASRLLVASPYTSGPHLLDLNALAPIAQLLAVALVELKPLEPTYALRPYPLAFNWQEIFAGRLLELLTSADSDIDKTWPIGKQQLFFVVFFRSRLQEHVDLELISRLDEESHAEATTSGGLLKYWFGHPDERRRNLATCIWTTKDAATEGGKGPWHRKARQAASKVYKEIEFGRLWLHLQRREGGIDWSFANDSV